MANIEHRLELLEAQYLTLRENVAKLEKVQYKIRDQIGFIEYMAKGPNYPDSLEERISEIAKAVDIVKNHLGIGSSSTSSIMVHTSQSSQFQVPQPPVASEQPQYAQQPQQPQYAQQPQQPQYAQQPQQPQYAQQPQQSQYAQPQVSSQSAYVQPGAVPAPQQPVATAAYQPPVQTAQPASIGGANIGTAQSAVPAPQPPIQPVEKMRQEVQKQLQSQMGTAQDQTLYYQPGPQSPPPQPAPAPAPQAPGNQSSQPVLRPQGGAANSAKKRKTVFKINPK